MSWNSLFSNKRSSDLDQRYSSFSTHMKQCTEKSKTESDKYKITGDTFIRADIARSRMNVIGRRNKRRSILVVLMEPLSETKMVKVLLNLNSRAKATYAYGIEQALEMLDEQKYDMVYAVTPFDQCHVKNSTCFYSLDYERDQEFVKSNKETSDVAEMLRKHIGEAELVAVCGTNAKECPIATKLFNEMNRKKPKKKSA